MSANKVGPVHRPKKRNNFVGHQHTYKGETDTWLTPQWLLDALGPFDLDPCAATEQPHRVAPRSYVEADDGLAQQWEGLVFCNPPYGPEVGKWLDKCAEHENTIALVFARVETVAMQKALRSAERGPRGIPSGASYVPKAGPHP